MKIFGEPALERKARKATDKLAAVAALAASGAIAFCVGVWLVGAVLHFAFRLMGVA